MWHPHMYTCVGARIPDIVYVGVRIPYMVYVPYTKVPYTM